MKSTACPLILIVEDEPAVAGLLATSLSLAGYEVTVAQNAQQALIALSSARFDAAVIDWMMPGMSGVDLIASLRQQSKTRLLPVLMLTAKAGENDKVLGLEVGADDYLVKPFSPRELTARIKALLRRAQPMRDDVVLRFGDLTLNPDQAAVVYTDTQAGKSQSSVELSHTEFKLLQCMMLQPQRVHTREHLLSQVWNADSAIDARTIDAHIKRLRQALLAASCPPCIETVRGVGYKLTLALAPVAA